MSSASHELALDQALHGYRDGHRLLASSRRLDSEASRQLLLLTDLAGSARDHFDGYVTASYLNTEDLFALSKTWYATEISRPGCVWTHTLLVEARDISIVNDLSALDALFERPLVDDYERYASRVFLSRAEVSRPPSLDVSDTTRLANLFNLLFATERSVLVPAIGASQHKMLFFLIWSLLWPALKTRFSFSTGPSDLRQPSGRSFDLSAIPESLSQHVDSRSSRAYEIAGSSDEHAPDWADSLAAHLRSSDNMTTNFIRDLGSTFRPERLAVSEIAQVYLEISAIKHGLEGLTKLLRRIAACKFLNDTGGLLTALLNPLKSQWPPAPDPELIEWMLQTEPISNLAVEDAELDLAPRIRSLSLAAQDRIFNYVQEAPTHAPSLFDTAFRRAIVEIILEKDDSIHALSRSLWPLIAAERPTSVLQMELKRLDNRAADAIIDAVIGSHTDNSQVISTIIEYELASGSERNADQIFDLSPSAACDAVFRIAGIRSYALSKLPFDWRRIFAGHPLEILAAFERLNLSDRNALRSLSILLPNRRLVDTQERTAWLNLPIPPEDDSALSLSVLKLVAGLNDPGSSALIDVTYEPVYMALMKSRLHSYEWESEYLEGRLPVLTPWENWDRCKRLRKAVVEHLIGNELPRESLLQSIGRSDIRDPLMSALGTVDQGYSS